VTTTTPMQEDWRTTCMRRLLAASNWQVQLTARQLTTLSSGVDNWYDLENVCHIGATPRS